MLSENARHAPGQHGRFLPLIDVVRSYDAASRRVLAARTAAEFAIALGELKFAEVDIARVCRERSYGVLALGRTLQGCWRRHKLRLRRETIALVSDAERFLGFAA